MKNKYNTSIVSLKKLASTGLAAIVLASGISVSGCATYEPKKIYVAPEGTCRRYHNMPVEIKKEIKKKKEYNIHDIIDGGGYGGDASGSSSGGATGGGSHSGGDSAGSR